MTCYANLTLFAAVSTLTMMHERTRDLLHKAVLLFVVLAPILGVILSMVLLWKRIFFLSDLFLFLGMYAVTILGITIGFHRMLTHKGFSAPWWLRSFLLIAGTMAMQGAPNQWAATHIVHHAHSDEEGDPHSPLDGFWHAHLGWLFDIHNYKDVRTIAPHLLQDRVAYWISRTFIFWTVLGFLIPFAIGGWTGLLWGGFVRAFFVNHVTYGVNSLCHSFGKRSFETTDESRNYWPIGVLAFGEGWHNNHHAFPTNAFHGLERWQIDFSGMLIHFWERTGLVWDVQRISPEAAEAQRARSLRSTTAREALRAQLKNALEAAQGEVERLIALSIAQVDDQRISDLIADATKMIKDIRRSVYSPMHLKMPRMESYMRQVELLRERIRMAFPSGRAA